jgi:hypothetical protein
MEFLNENRNRYYGLMVGDLVVQKLSKKNGDSICEVIELTPMDNNSVVLKDSENKTFEWVAEWCQIVGKVEKL